MFKKALLLATAILIWLQGNNAGQASPTKAVLTLETLRGNMIFIQGSQFMMGCTKEQGGQCFRAENPQHSVIVANFSICRYPVTQGLWKQVMGNNPSFFKGCDDCPVESVSWDNAQEFIGKLNALTGGKYRLPTEAEWEYAARGGNKSAGYIYPGGNDINSLAWYEKNSNGRTHPVGLKKPNELGLYDMAGNVMEWCQDWFNAYGSDLAIHPAGPETGRYRVLRGSSWIGSAANCRVSDRDSNVSDCHTDNLGFRLASD